ncbi:MAG TPA: methylmalonyl-CoA epimerase [Thermoplasmata archaeon]|nr:methylmalonyl-CoA epimerase [Thermoplasmata archaeon]
MIGPVDHVGVAVRRLDAAVERYGLLGLALESIETVPAAGVRVAFLNGGGIHVELVEPVDPAGTVARFLEKRGEGLHHLAFATQDIAGELGRLAGEGFELIDPVPRPGARGRQVAFVHPRSAHGVLIELVQRPS